MTTEKFNVKGGEATFTPSESRTLAKRLEEIGMLDEFWGATDLEKYPQEHLFGPNGRAVAMANDLVSITS